MKLLHPIQVAIVALLICLFIFVSAHAGQNNNQRNQEYKHFSDSIQKSFNEVLNAKEIPTKKSKFSSPSEIIPLAKCDDDKVVRLAKDLGLRKTFAYCVYCQVVDDNGAYKNQKHYVYNPAKNKFILLPGIKFIPSSGINNEMVQANIQKYNFTNADGVYAKDGNFYTYDIRKSKFVRIK